MPAEGFFDRHRVLKPPERGTGAVTSAAASRAALSVGSRRPRLTALERRLGYEFQEPTLLRQALLHRSYLNENPGELLESNERLEFIGDAILNMVVSRRLYDDYPGAGEGWLTEVRSRLVRNDTLALLAEHYDLGRYLVMGRGVEAQNGRNRPAILGRTLEAVIGAIYLDGGLRAAQRYILELLKPELNVIAIAGLERDPKSLLQQACQAHRHAAPSYHTVEERGPAHEREFTVEVRLEGRPLGRGEGKSKQVAEKAAAEAALQALPEDAIP